MHVRIGGAAVSPSYASSAESNFAAEVGVSFRESEVADPSNGYSTTTDEGVVGEGMTPAVARVVSDAHTGVMDVTLDSDDDDEGGSDDAEMAALGSKLYSDLSEEIEREVIKEKELAGALLEDRAEEEMQEEEMEVGSSMDAVLDGWEEGRCICNSC